MKIFLPLIFVIYASISAYAQTSVDSFVGTWVLSKDDERIVFFITKAGNRYKAQASLAAEEPDEHDVFTATRVKTKLIGSNKSVFTALSKNRLHVKNFYFEGGDEFDLERINDLSGFYGIWKAFPTDKQFILLYRYVSCSTDEECLQAHAAQKDCVEIQLTQEMTWTQGPNPYPIMGTRQMEQGSMGPN